MVCDSVTLHSCLLLSEVRWDCIRAAHSACVRKLYMQLKAHLPTGYGWRQTYQQDEAECLVNATLASTSTYKHMLVEIIGGYPCQHCGSWLVEKRLIAPIIGSTLE